MFSNEGSHEYARVVARSWADSEFRERLIADPRTVLGEHGIAVPDDLVVSVRRGGSSKLELALPDRPAMADEVLAGSYASGTKPTAGGTQVSDSHGNCYASDSHGNCYVSDTHHTRADAVA